MLFRSILGPNSTDFGNTVPQTIKTQLVYVTKVLRKVATQGIRTITPTAAAMADFRAYCEAFFPRTVMSMLCSSWYNSGIPGGRIHGVWPGSGQHSLLVRKEPRWEDFEYTHRNQNGNRFSYFGKGWTTKDVRANEGEEGLNFTPYLTVDTVRGEVD